MENPLVKKFLVFFSTSYLLALPVFANSNIDSLFSEFNKPSVPGASVVVIKGGVVDYVQAYGLQRLKPAEPTSILTNYRLASVSKQFTAMAILILVDQGKLKLDTALTDIFSDFPAYGRKIRIFHLLNHTSGLKDYEDMEIGTEQILDAGVLALLKKQNSTDFEPGSMYRYSNGGYCVLSQIVEKISGESFGAFTKKYIFDPIGMNKTQFFVKGETLVENRAYGYTQSGNAFEETDQSNTSATMGDGGVYTSASEWVDWENALQKSLLVNPMLQKAMFTPGVLNDGSKTNYGFGFALDTYKDYERHSHTGSTIGFRTAMQRFPEKGLSILVVINRANTTPWNIAQKIADLYL